MDIRKVPISSVVPWPKNPRGVKESDFARLKKQITDLGPYKPLVCYEEDGQYVVLGGNMRIRALKELGFKEVEISIVAPKSEAEKIAISLSDNDRVGYYEEQALAELVYPEVANLDLKEFKVDLTEPWMDLQRVINGVGPEDAWGGMPEFEQKDEQGFRTIVIHFIDEAAVEKFIEVTGLHVSDKARYLWYPEKIVDHVADLRIASES